MSNGLACIVNNYGVPFTEKEVNIMNNNSPETIAEALTYFINHPQIINDLSINSIRKIKNEFSIHSFTRFYIEQYKNLLH
jgi:glycosyltransferase involved in cell wall biosynthesis